MKIMRPQVPRPCTGFAQGRGDRLFLARQPGIDQRIAVLVIEDQGQVQETLGLPRTPRYGQDINTVGDSHRSPLGPYIRTAAVRDITLPWLVWLAYADGSI